MKSKKVMMKANQLLLSLLISLLVSCTPKVQENKVTTTEKKVLTEAQNAKVNKAESPIKLSHRKLEVAEISKHLDMDEENTVAHLRATNVHGYYSLIAKNYPPGAEFILYQVDLAKNVRPVKTFLVNGNGRLVTQLDDLYIDLENNYLFFSNYLPGEPVDFILGSKDQRYYAGTRIVPNPILAEDSMGRSVSVQIDHADKRHYLIHCTGCIPFESYMLITGFENEKLVHTVQANEEGEIMQLAGPTVPWVANGEGFAELRGEGLEKPLSVHFEWGF